ncbi:uncharacterized protein AB9X84_004667 [Acanthopagrus schlegelii]
MTEWKLLFVLLLPLHLCSHTEEVVMKTIGREPDVTPVCDSATLHIITLIVCKIRREISGGEECRLLYQHGQDFVHECDSRFTLKTENETVFLHLTALTPEDSGNYSCECSHVHGTDILHVIITVKGEEEASTSVITMLNYVTVISCGTAFAFVTCFLLGLAVMKIHRRVDTRSGPSGLSVCETSCSLVAKDKDEPDNHYTSLRQPGSDLYQSVSPTSHQYHSMENSASNNTAPEQFCEIYEIL